MAGAFHELMLRLDYPRYVSQGGGWGAIISELLAVQAPRSYCEGTQAGGGPFDAFDIPTLPVAVTVFPAEIYRAPRTWGEQSFGNLIYWNEVDKAGHFAASEQPELFSAELREAFRLLR